MKINIFDEENLDLQDDEMNDEIYINPVVDEEDEQNEYERMGGRNHPPERSDRYSHHDTSGH